MIISAVIVTFFHFLGGLFASHMIHSFWLNILTYKLLCKFYGVNFWWFFILYFLYFNHQINRYRKLHCYYKFFVLLLHILHRYLGLRWSYTKKSNFPIFNYPRIYIENKVMYSAEKLFLLGLSCHRHHATLSY